ncbi:MAG: hypothetical protein QOF56_2072 [Acidobacteriaceae bacterium]|nr:hypothetical protein [Acidobacteriaceae bacterium]
MPRLQLRSNSRRGSPHERCRVSTRAVSVEPRIGLAGHCLQVQTDLQEADLDAFRTDVFGVLHSLVVGKAQSLYVCLRVEPCIDVT